MQQTGTVIWFKNDHGFGFLSPDEGGPDVFVHHSGIDMAGYRKLEKGQRVKFEVETGPKGKPQAVHVKVLI